MLGKMSVGVRRITTGAAIRISKARTMNVYGRLRAILTIHMVQNLSSGEHPVHDFRGPTALNPLWNLPGVLFTAIHLPLGALARRAPIEPNKRTVVASSVSR